MKYVNCPVCGHKLIKGEDIGIAIVKCGHWSRWSRGHGGHGDGGNDHRIKSKKNFYQ